MPPLPPDPYKTLGVSNTAPVADIRTAYRKLVLTCHPDKVQDPAQKGQKLEEFQKLQVAYELLTDDKERTRYDEQVMLMELRKEVTKNMPNTSAPRTPRTAQTYNVSIRTAEPRPSTYAQSPPQAGSRLYAQNPGTPKDSYTFVEEKARTTKRSPSYEKPPSSRKERDYDEDKERKERERARRRREREEEREERQKERELETERERERERERRLVDKDSRKAEKKRQDKERKSAALDDKRQHRSGTYVEEYDDVDVTRPEKKKSSSRKHRERERDEPTPVVDIGSDQTHEKVRHAEHYIQARSYPGLERAATHDAATFRNSPPSVPTPPPPRDSAYPVPPAPHVMEDSDDSDEEEDAVHRSRAASRRDSYDPSRSTERTFLHKKSYSSIKDDPIMLSTSPGRLSMMSESPPRGSLPKSSTFHEGSHRSIPKSAIPPPVRSYSYSGDSADPRDPRGRSRSRFHPQRVPEEEEEDEEEERQQHMRKHRSSRREPSTDPISIPYKKHPYGGEGRSAGREPSYRNSPDSRHTKTYFPSSGSSGHRVVESAYSHEPRAHYTKFKTTKLFDTDDVSWGQYNRAYKEVDAHY